jgi:hypothetical protein
VFTIQRWLYRKLFSVDEIAQDIVLQWMAGAILLGFFVTFDAWMYSDSTTIKAVNNGSYLCWPHFQNCKYLIWLSVLPDGYSQTIVFMFLFGLIGLAIWAIKESAWEYVHAIILILLAAKLYFTLIDYNHKGNYDYYHNTFCIIFLFAVHKKFFLKFVMVFFYFLSTASKIHESWILGEYFTSLKTGLPLFPAGTELLMTNLVIGMEMVAAWLLFSRIHLVQRAILLFFIVFHLYSGILVGYRYPATCLPPLIILFGPWHNNRDVVPAGIGTLRGWSMMAALLIIQLFPRTIAGDEKLTLEGNYYGLYMFEANHQCFWAVKKDSKIVWSNYSANARNRCDPYDIWFRAKNRFCKTPGDQVSMGLSHSINGHPFQEIVNESDICGLRYRPFGRNSWIKDEKQAPIVGQPVQNFYR